VSLEGVSPIVPCALRPGTNDSGSHSAFKLCTENAVMIAEAGYYRFLHGIRDERDIDVLPNWGLSLLDGCQQAG
jgi:tRNA A37 threonylcarbamoyltransferase TsaD